VAFLLLWAKQSTMRGIVREESKTLRGIFPSLAWESIRKVYWNCKFRFLKNANTDTKVLALLRICSEQEESNDGAGDPLGLRVASNVLMNAVN